MNKIKKLLYPVLLVLGLIVVGASIWLANQSNQESASVAVSPHSTEASSSQVAKADSSSSETASSTSSSSQAVRGVNKPERKGPSAPDTKLLDELGNTIALSSKFGKPTIINIWASWCPPCREEMPYFLEAYRQYGDKVNFVMINATGSHPDETAEKAQAYLKEAGLTDLPIYYDDQRQNQIAFNAVSLPTTYILNAKGEIITRGQGSVPREELFKVLEQMVAEQ